MIVIPMAGRSRRFFDAGYKCPKYMLPLHGRSVFSHAVTSFSHYFSESHFLFVTRSDDDVESFIRRECAQMGLVNFQIILLGEVTAGQAETIERGLLVAGVTDEEPITVFNIDTFRVGFRYPKEAWFATSAGYLEVFQGQGANWSYVSPRPGCSEPLVDETAEKTPISNLCCNGLYYFAQAGHFLRALQRERLRPTMNELYVAPLYNHLIRCNLRIHFALIPTSATIFCGVPDEYERLRGDGLDMEAPWPAGH